MEYQQQIEQLKIQIETSKKEKDTELELTKANAKNDKDSTVSNLQREIDILKAKIDLNEKDKALAINDVNSKNQ